MEGRRRGIIQSDKSQRVWGRARAPGAARVHAAVGKEAKLGLMKVLEGHSWDVGVEVGFLEWL